MNDKTARTAQKRRALSGLIIPFFFAISACTPAPDVNSTTRAATPLQDRLPPIKSFSDPNPQPPFRANSDIARDFLDLSFQLESGSDLSTFTRFEGPITVQVTGAPPATLLTDLDRLIHRMRSEAQIPISRVRSGPANITIQAVSRRDIQRYQPSAACFVVPNISSLDEYRAFRRSQKTSWGSLRQRNKLAIFLPNDVSPQEARDCLHEELAQSLGPLNDLYRLSDSVYNDDNMNNVLTGFDMLILRATYQPELHSGMTRDQVAYRLPMILSRLNPRGDSLSPRQTSKTPRSWIKAIETALGPNANTSKRMRAAKQALAIAKSEGWRDQRLGFSNYTLGRLTKRSNPGLSMTYFRAALKAYQETPGTALHQANTAIQLAALALDAGQPEVALNITTPYIADATRYEDAALLANLMLLRAESYEQMGQRDKARDLRLDSLGWARYGFGTEWVLRSNLSDMTAAPSLTNKNG
jgi:hypothetical protein